MKRPTSFAALLVFALAASASHAAENRAAQIEHRVQAAKDRLQLTDEQVERITPVLEESLDAQRRILSRYGIDPDAPSAQRERLGLRKAQAMKRDFEAARAATLASVGDILTRTQVDEFKRIQQERANEMRSRIVGGG